MCGGGFRENALCPSNHSGVQGGMHRETVMTFTIRSVGNCVGNCYDRFTDWRKKSCTVKYVTADCKSCATLVGRLVAAVYHGHQSPSSCSASGVYHDNISLFTTARTPGLAYLRPSDVWSGHSGISATAIRQYASSQAPVFWSRLNLQANSGARGRRPVRCRQGQGQ